MNAKAESKTNLGQTDRYEREWELEEPGRCVSMAGGNVVGEKCYTICLNMG